MAHFAEMPPRFAQDDNVHVGAREKFSRVFGQSTRRASWAAPSATLFRSADVMNSQPKRT
jgi:hypothetical protein